MYKLLKIRLGILSMLYFAFEARTESKAQTFEPCLFLPDLLVESFKCLMLPSMPHLFGNGQYAGKQAPIEHVFR